MPRTIRRPLTLHVSALSDAEYDSYTSSLAEITCPLPDVDWEDITLGVREARAWIRGRYGAGLDGNVIDQILRNFSPELGPNDTLTGGQFFAVLRLVCHVQAGAKIDQSLVFVQADTEPSSRPLSPSKSVTPGRSSSTKAAPPPPPRPSSDAVAAAPPTPSLPPRTVPSVPTHNPFTRTQSHPGPTHSHGRRDSQSPFEKEKLAPEPPVSANPFRKQFNPQSQPISPPKPAALSLSSASSASSSSPPRQYAYTSPPLPPRKPSTAALLPPPRHASLTAASAIQKSRASGNTTSSKASMASLPFSSPALPPPPKPPKPPQATSPLIKQSLQAAKGAQSVKEIMDGLSKERRWEVIKKSGGGGNGSGNGTSSGSGSGDGSAAGSHNRSGEGTPRRPPSLPESYYDVAAARIGRPSSPSASSSASSSPAHDRANSNPIHTHQLTHAATPNRITPQFPFTHVLMPNTPPSPSPSSTGPDIFSTPDTFSSPPNSPTVPNPRRTKSLHHPSPASSASSSPTSGPPLPPPRRRRPESMQATSEGRGGSSYGNGSGVSGSPFADGGSPSSNGMHGRIASAPSPLSRHMSFSSPATHSSHDSPHSSSGAGSVLDTLHRTIQTLRPGPGFESARVRAEGRVWPGGYVKGLAKGPGFSGEGREGARLVGDDGNGDGGFGQDRDGAGMDDGERVGGGYGKNERGGRMERDELKMPVRPGEGWTTLA